MAESRWAIAGAVLGLVAGAVVFAPAVWLAGAIDRISGGQVQLAEARGTVWDGDARLVLSGGAASRDARILPGRVSWTLRPGLPTWRLGLAAECCTAQPQRVDLALLGATRRMVFSDGQSHWPAALLGGLGAPWNTVQPRGRLRLRTQGLSLEWVEGRVQVQGSATLDVLDLSSGLSTLRPVGSYRVQLKGSGQAGPPQLLLETLEGSLKLSGQGQWNGSRWNFRGQASAAPEMELVLGNLLNIVGRRQGARSEITID